MVKYPGFKWNEERSTRIDVTPGPAMQKEIEGESIGEGECSDGKLDKARGFVNSGAGSQKHVEGQAGRGGCVKHSTAWCELESGQYKQALHYLVGEGRWGSAERLYKRLIREEDINITEIVRRIKVPYAPEEARHEQNSGGGAGLV